MFNHITYIKICNCDHNTIYRFWGLQYPIHFIGYVTSDFCSYFDPTKVLVEDYGLAKFQSANLLLDQLGAAIISVPTFVAMELCKNAL